MNKYFLRKLDKLALTYLIMNIPSVFTQNKDNRLKEVIMVIPQNYFYFLALHFKLSTIWYSTQLVELFAYDSPVVLQNHSVSQTVVSYNFHNLFSNQRFFIFTWNSTLGNSGLKSVSSLFANSSWLEREASEMSGVIFEGKEDLRNLLLTYGDSSSPLRKSVPSVGFKEIYYDINNDLLVQTPVTLQI